MNFGNVDHNCLVMVSTSRSGVRRETRFWAERGLIRCEDSLTGYSVMTVKQFLRQVKAINDMLGNSKASRDSGADADLRQRTQQHVDKAVEIARIAQEQGQPSDPSARRDLRRRQPRTIAVSDNVFM